MEDRSPSRAGALLTRAWFRRRLDADPRRWVVLLAALEGLGVAALSTTKNPGVLGHGSIGAAMWFLIMMLAPMLGVLAVLAHARVVWWTGKLLGGRARPPEIHAALAWAELPFVITAAPLILSMPFLAAAALMDPLPQSVRLVDGFVHRAYGPLVGIPAIAALGGAVLCVRFLGEAQGFSSTRAFLNQLLAALTLVLFVAAGALAGFLSPAALGSGQVVVALALIASLAAVAEYMTHRRSDPGTGAAHHSS